MRRAVGVLAAGLAALVMLPNRVLADPPERQAILILADGLSYEGALVDPLFRAYSRAGGIGLMTTRVSPKAEDPEASAYATIGAGEVADGPSGPLTTVSQGEGALLRTGRLDSGQGQPGALGEALTEAGMSVGFKPHAGPNEPDADQRGLLIAMDEEGRVPFIVGTVADPGVGAVLEADMLVVDLGSVDSSAADLAEVIIRRSDAESLLIIVVLPLPSETMRARGDVVTPVIVARGRPPDNLGSGVRGLTSETTHRAGVVANIDIAPTILHFLGVPIPATMDGSPIRVEGEPPTRLHTRFLQQQRLRVPIQVLPLAAILSALLASVIVLFLWRSAPRRVLRGVAVFGLFVVAVGAFLIPASYLPDLTYATVVPVLFGGGAILTWVAIRLGRGSLVMPVAIVAAAWLAGVVGDGILGFPSALTPLLGGGALEGARFFGLPNAYGGILLGGSVLVAAMLRPWAGAGLLAAAGLFAGLPFLGANFGEGVTLIAVAALWWALRIRGRLGLREIAIAAAAVVAGAALLLFVPSPIETHVSRLVEETGRSGFGEVIAVIGRRLRINFETTNHIPAAWLVPVALPAILIAGWRRLAPFRPVLIREPAWRDGIVVLALGGIAAFLANDTGISVAGLALIPLFSALLYPTLVERWKSG